MPAQPPTPDQIASSFAHAVRLRAEIARKELAIRRRTQTIAKGLAMLMEPGTLIHRRGIAYHAFNAGDAVYLAATYLEEERGDFHYRYVVLSGSEPAMRALRTAELDLGASDEPGQRRHIALATYVECEDFLARLPVLLTDVMRRLEGRMAETEAADARLNEGRRALARIGRRHRTP